MNFWDVHGFIFLIGITFFPRITLLFSSVVTGGLFWWLGFIFTPHLLVAILATYYYWDTNIVLVLISWFLAYEGTKPESKATINMKRRYL